MAHFVYPAVFYYDSEYQNYAVAFPDVNIYTDGDTMEDAYKNAQEYLLSYLDCCEQLGKNPEQPSDFASVSGAHKNANESVMLVAVDFKSDKKVPLQKVDDIFEDVEESVFVQAQESETKNFDFDNDDDDDGEIFSLPEIE